MRNRKIYFRTLSEKEQGRQAAIFYRKMVKQMTQETKEKLEKGEITFDAALETLNSDNAEIKQEIVNG